MKKILMTLPVFAFAMAFASSASALYFPMWGGSDDLSVSSSNSAWVTDNTSASSNTGNNHTGMNWGGGNIMTGGAGSIAESNLGVNSNQTTVNAPCDCYDDVTVSSKNRAFVTTNTKANSNTGNNGTMFNLGGFSGGGNIATGVASSAAGSWTVVNSNVTSF